MTVIDALTLPCEVWLVGKGPSLSTYDWSKATGPVICVNESVFIVPNPFAAIAIDYNVLDKYQGLDTLILRKESHRKYDFKNMYVWTYPTHVPGEKTGTVTIATQVLYTLGARIIHYVGCDSIDGEAAYDESIIAIDAKGTNSDGFRNINRALLKTISQLGITAIWEHRNES